MTRLVAMTGLPCAGKSSVAAAVARSLPATLLEVDAVEDAVVRAGLPRSFETGLAGYLVAEAVAAAQLRGRRDVVVDAANLEEPARETWRSLAARTGATLSWVEVVCGDETEHRRRAERRDRGYVAGLEPRWSGIVRRRAESDPWPSGEARVRVDTAAQSAESLARQVLDALREG